jgi:two-component system osmolarity sensor histidine kinase EnvZ
MNVMTWLPRTLFGRTLLTLGGLSFAFVMISVVAVAQFMLVPLGKRTADELASIMIHAADVWIAQPASEHESFRRDMSRNHDLLIGDPTPQLPPTRSWLPYFGFLEQALAARLDSDVRVLESRDDQSVSWFWVDIPRGDRSVRLGFSRARLGVYPTGAITLVGVAGVLSGLAAAILLSRGLTTRIAGMGAAARAIGSGQWPEPVPEGGPAEIADLATAFNRMNRQVQELLANRTVLLAGISHDLGGPVTRLRLALALMPKDRDQALTARMERDVEEMERLVLEVVEISRGIEEDRREMIDVPTLLSELVDKARHSDAEINLHRGEPCPLNVHRLTLSRVVLNLIENAVRHGGGGPVDVGHECAPDGLTITIADRGPGIAEDLREHVFRPFYSSRNRSFASLGLAGSGLGLAIARQLAETQRWRLELRQRDGGGTEAVVTIDRRNAS